MHDGTHKNSLFIIVCMLYTHVVMYRNKTWQIEERRTGTICIYIVKMSR